MKKFLTFALIGAVLLGVSSVVYANVCAFDAVPAATLLFPFVEYDYVNGGAGGTTLFSITNVSSEAQVVHVTLWTDYSVAILDFNILLTGYDVQTMNIRDILESGILPVTGGNDSPVGDTPNSDGPISETNTLNGDWIAGLLADPESTAVLTCDTGDPQDYADGIDGPILALFEAWLMKSQAAGARDYDTCGAGATSVVGTWWLDDDFNAARKTWMYITADVVTECNLAFPNDPTGVYFTSFLDGANVLMGDVIYLDPTNGFSEALNAVHLEADMDLYTVGTPIPDSIHPVSFYGRYADTDIPAWDYREPLGTAWAFRYFTDAANSAETYIRAWKGGVLSDIVIDLILDSDDQNVSTFTARNCQAYTYYAWDEEEDVTSVSDNPWSIPGVGNEVPNLLPLETQEVNVTEFTLPDAFGWMLFVWPNSNFDAIVGADAPDDWYQTWMGVRYKAFGQYSAAIDGALMANYNCFDTQVLPNLGIHYDYVNAGGFTP